MAEDRNSQTDSADQSDVTCAICFETWKKPKVTPTCSHIFCAECLETLISQSAPELVGEEQTFKCPLCRKLNYLPPGGVQELQVNAFLDGFTTKLRAAEEAKLQVANDAAKEVSRATQFKSQPVLMWRKPQVAVCMDHGDVPLDFRVPPAKLYCYECNRLVCLDCFDDKHGLHCVTKVDEALHLKSRRCKELLNDLAHLIPNCLDSMQSLDELMAQCELQTSTAVERVIREVDDMMKYFDSLKCHFIAHAQSLATRVFTDLQRSGAVASNRLDCACRLEKQLQEVLVNDDVSEMVMKMRFFEDSVFQLRNWESEFALPDSCEEIDFTSCYDDLREAGDLVMQFLDHIPSQIGAAARNALHNEEQINNARRPQSPSLWKYDREEILRLRWSPFANLGFKSLQEVRKSDILRLRSTRSSDYLESADWPCDVSKNHLYPVTNRRCRFLSQPSSFPSDQHADATDLQGADSQMFATASGPNSQL